MKLAGVALVGASILGYALEGAGPLAGNYAPAEVTERAKEAAAIAASLPKDAAVSATASLVPRISHRPSVYVFPAVSDADFVFLDLDSSPAPTSAGDVFLRAQSLIDSGEWSISTQTDGLLVLARGISTTPQPPLTLGEILPAASIGEPPPPKLVDAALVPSPEGAIDVDGPHWILKTTWRTEIQPPPGTRLEFWIDTQSGERLHRWDIADLWWNPPERWAPGQDITVNVSDIPVREFKSWSATWSST